MSEELIITVLSAELLAFTIWLLAILIINQKGGAKR